MQLWLDRAILRAQPASRGKCWAASSQLKCKLDAIGTHMDISRGFQIEQPELFVPWKISPSRLQRIFSGHVLRCISEKDYFTTSCTSLGGLNHELGFHFERLFLGLFGPARLVRLQFFRASYPAVGISDHLAASYHEFQRHLETTFGKPTNSFPGTEGFDTHVWRFCDVKVTHCVYERFTIAENVGITKL